MLDCLSQTTCLWPRLLCGLLAHCTGCRTQGLTDQLGVLLEACVAALPGQSSPPVSAEPTGEAMQTSPRHAHHGQLQQQAVSLPGAEEQRLEGRLRLLLALAHCLQRYHLLLGSRPLAVHLLCGAPAWQLAGLLGRRALCAAALDLQSAVSVLWRQAKVRA